MKDKQDENKLVVPPLVFELDICDKDTVSCTCFWGEQADVNSSLCCLFIHLLSFRLQFLCFQSRGCLQPKL